MDEAVDRFTPYEDSGVPSFLEESAPFGFDSFDGSAASASAASTAGANTEIMSTHIDPVSGPTECGGNSGSGSGGAVRPDVLVRAHRQSTRTRLISPVATAHVIGDVPARTGVGSIRPQKRESTSMATSGGIAVREATVITATASGDGNVSIGGGRT